MAASLEKPFEAARLPRMDDTTVLEQIESTQPCKICLLSLDEDFVSLACGDSCCKPCLKQLFKTALKDETLFPPRCCGVRVTVKTVRAHLPRSIVKQYRAMKLELSTRDRTYCWRPTCSTFIAPHSVHNDQAICQRCRSRTCIRCKNSWHYGPCAVLEEDAAFFEMMREEEWQKCPGCRRIVERDDGCDHMR